MSLLLGRMESLGWFYFAAERKVLSKASNLLVSNLQVAAIYKDSSIGNLINIVIVKLVVIHSEQVRSRLQRGLLVVVGFWWD